MKSHELEEFLKQLQEKKNKSEFRSIFFKMWEEAISI